ncbi:MAG: hypothetical protein LBP21_10875 [Synergistaceae bacterium]|nr:hypothetical protein [Synergistaceae bacterium]
MKIQAPNPGPNTTKAAENFTISAPYLQVTDGGAYVAGWDDFTWPSFKVAVVEDKITLNPTDVYATVGVEVPIDTKIDAEFNSAVLTIGEYRELNSSVQSIPWNGLILSSDKRVVTITGTPKSPGNGHFRVFAKSRVDAVVIASADFTVHVTDTANFTLYPSDNIELDPDQPADEEVKVRTTMTLSKLTITPPGGSKTDSIGNWHGLTISVKNDNDNPRVIIIGAPPLEEGTGNFTITGSSSTGEERSATLTITIKTPDAPTPPDIPKLTLSPSTLNPIVGKEFDKDVAITVPSGLSVSNITVNGQGAVEWHGLTIVVDTNGRNINVFGTPNEEGTKNFDVAAQALDPIASAILTITVHPQTEEGRTRGKFMDVDGEIQVERGKSTPIELRSLSYITVDSVTEVNPDGKWEWIQGSSLEGVKEFYVSVHPTVTGLYTLRINYSLGGTAYYENVNYRSIRTDEEDLASSGCSMSAGSVTLAALAVLYLCLMRKKV